MMAGYFATLARDSATGTQYFITQGSSEVSGALPDSTHLEADFRLVGHMLYAARNGCSRTIIRGNDTDICIIFLAYQFLVPTNTTPMQQLLQAVI